MRRRNVLREAPRAAQRRRQARARAVRRSIGTARLRNHLDGRNREGAAQRRARHHRGRGRHRLSGDHGRPRQDPASAHSRRPAGAARRRRQRARRAWHRRHRAARRESVPLRSDDGAARLHGRRGHREHRRRRPCDAACGRQEPRAHRRRRRSCRLRRSARGAQGRRRPGGHAPPARRESVQPHGPLRHGDQPLPAHAQRRDRRLGEPAAAQLRPRRGAALRREPASARRAVPHRGARAGLGRARAARSRARSSRSTTSSTRTRPIRP